MANLAETSFYGEDDQRLQGPKGDPGDTGPQGPAGPPGPGGPIPTYASNAEALAAGAVPGTLYHLANGAVFAVLSQNIE